MKCKNIVAALACALLVLGLAGCGATKGVTNHLESIQISSSNTDEINTGTISIGVNGPVVGPIQLYVWGNYSSGKQKLLNGAVYSIALDPTVPNAVDPNTNTLYLLDAPPLTMQLSATGLLTAVDPSACSWYNANVGKDVSDPAWSMVGNYTVTATYGGMTTPPVYVAVASAPGVVDIKNNPSGACGPGK